MISLWFLILSNTSYSREDKPNSITKLFQKGDNMIKKLISFSFLALILFIFSNNLKAQTLYFCESVDKDGYAVTESSVFNISRDGGYLDMLVRIPYDLGSTSVKFVIYKVDSYGSEVYDNTIYQDTQRDWRWFWKQVTFYDAGKYNVYVYDGSDYLLTSGSVRIQYR
jgi:hypothetical protein